MEMDIDPADSADFVNSMFDTDGMPSDGVEQATSNKRKDDGPKPKSDPKKPRVAKVKEAHIC